MRYVLFLLSVLFFVYPVNVSAASINVTSNKTELTNPLEEVSVDIELSIQASDNTIYYLRGVFSKQGSKNYCGYTWNGSSWFNGPYSTNEGWKNFLPVTIQNNVWRGVLKAKLDTIDSGCAESGQYLFKIQRFTPSGSAVFDTQNDQIFTIVLPTPTFTPTPSPKPTPTLTPTKVLKIALTPTPTLAKGITVVPQKVTSTPTRHVSIPHSSFSAILGISSISAVPSQIKIPTIKPTEIKEKVKVQGMSTVMIGSGVIILLVSCGILSIQILRRKLND